MTISNACYSLLVSTVPVFFFVNNCRTAISILSEDFCSSNLPTFSQIPIAIQVSTTSTKHITYYSYTGINYFNKTYSVKII